MVAMDSELLAGRYELVAPVGKGATGEVWRGLDRLLRRPVAIKLVDLVSARDPAMSDRFRREGVAIAGVSHDSIVKVYDTGTDEHRGWLVMELLSGPNLNALVKESGPLGYAVGMPLLARVAEGLQAAHDAGITHRDVKPANIVLDAPMAPDGTKPDLNSYPERGRPVLVDFGIAHIVDDAGTQLTRPATAIGTAAYMSPEQARGQQVSSASDVYSLGCVAYHVFLGRPPFTGESSLAVAHAQAFDAPVPLAELSPDVPPALDTLVARMLDKDPTRRPTARDVADELRLIAAEPQMAPTVALAATRTALLADADPPAGFRHAGRWSVGLLIVGLVVALAYSWFARDLPTPTPGATVTMTTTATQSTQTPTRSTTIRSSGAPSSLLPSVTSQSPTASVPTGTGATTSAPATTASQAPTSAPPGQGPSAAPTTAAPTTSLPVSQPSQIATPAG